MYKLKKKGKSYTDHTIEKTYEHTLTFTIADIDAHQRLLEKTLKEFTAQLELETAKYMNVSDHHAWVTKLSPEELHTANLFYETVKMMSALRPKIKEIKKQIKEYKEERAAIMSELGLSDESDKA